MNPQNSSRVTTPPSAPLAARSFSKAKTIARRLGVCPRTIFRWADQGRITRHKINARVVLFDEQDVETLLREARIELPST